MRQSISTWRAFVAGFVVAGALFFTGSAAYAHLVSSESWYWTGTDAGGTIWCAYHRAGFSEASGSSYQAMISGMTEAHKDLYCSNIAGAPSGYIFSSTRLVYSSGTVCRDYLGSVTYNPATYPYSYQAWELRGPLTACSSGTYKTQLFSGAALDFSWRYSTIFSPNHALTP